MNNEAREYLKTPFHRVSIIVIKTSVALVKCSTIILASATKLVPELASSYQDSANNFFNYI